MREAGSCPPVKDQTWNVVYNLVGHDAAVLVIDVQRSLFGKPTPIYRADELLTNIAVLVERARAVGALVIYVQHSSHRQLQLGSEDWQVHPKLVPRDDDLIVHKTHGNAFEETLLHGELSTRGIQRLVVTGLVTHGCVRATVQGGLQLGYEMIVASDAHSSYRKDADRIVENWNRQLHDAGAVIVPTAQPIH